jgi:DNA-binding winged helix-turn-helix (wHTH) protein
VRKIQRSCKKEGVLRLQFGEFLLDSDARQLLQRGAPIHLSRKAFDALCLLAERRPTALAKDDLHAALWPGTHVVEASLSVTIAEIRRALDDDPQAPRYIRTVHRVGYAFCAEAVDAAGAGRGAPKTPRAWLAWEARVLPLEEGENLIGREPGCGVWLDESGVSRRHARLVLEGDRARIEDLGSKNGTWVNGRPITREDLSGGDRVQIGPLTLEFRTSSRAADTETVRLNLGAHRPSGARRKGEE